MYNAYRTRSRSFLAAIAAVAVTAALASSLVESFDPAQLIQLEKKSTPAQVVAASFRSKALPKAIRKALPNANRRHA